MRIATQLANILVTTVVGIILVGFGYMFGVGLLTLQQNFVIRQSPIALVVLSTVLLLFAAVRGSIWWARMVVGVVFGLILWGYDRFIHWPMFGIPVLVICMLAFMVWLANLTRDHVEPPLLKTIPMAIVAVLVGAALWIVDEFVYADWSIIGLFMLVMLAMPIDVPKFRYEPKPEPVDYDPTSRERVSRFS